MTGAGVAIHDGHTGPDPQSVGQDNEAVWGGILGLGAEERARLAEAGVI